ncbi:hypothetical protein MUK42_07158 [Musa troglodytarum]|uniref:Uncharacterized protein n=1 Tax=Musa troglodytarum TaxID=320322 RepID=A0A9E7GAR2_9LILI|nr:hypothetical protein MUK42_07158 [Musa troglodytarum]
MRKELIQISEDDSDITYYPHDCIVDFAAPVFHFFGWFRWRTEWLMSSIDTDKARPYCSLELAWVGFCIFDAQANESDSTSCRLMQCALQKEKFVGDTLNK